MPRITIEISTNGEPAATEVMQTVVAELASTDANLDYPTAADYAADIVRRLDTAYELHYSDGVHLPGRLHDMVASYFAGAYRDSEAVAHLDEIMRHLGELLDVQNRRKPPVPDDEHLL